MTKSQIAISVGIIALVGTVLLWKFGTIKSTGIPHGLSARLPGAIATIIRTQEPYFPTLHRNPDNDRFRLDLLLTPLDGSSKSEMISLVRSKDRSVLQPMTKILGADGSLIWLQAPEITAVNLQTKRVITVHELEQANPDLGDLWETVRYEFETQLFAISRDHQRAFAIDATTLKANPAVAPKRAGWVNPNRGPELLLCSGGLIAPSEWFGVLSPKDRESSFKTGFSLPRDNPVNPANEQRRLYLASITPNETRARIEGMQALSETTYQNAAMVRRPDGPALLRLATPDSVLMTHRSDLTQNATTLVTRIDAKGHSSWTTDSGIGRLEQILPDENIIAFLGTRPAVPGKVPEPILVLINTASGAAVTHSLWR